MRKFWSFSFQKEEKRTTFCSHTVSISSVRFHFPSCKWYYQPSSHPERLSIGHFLFPKRRFEGQSGFLSSDELRGYDEQLRCSCYVFPSNKCPWTQMEHNSEKIRFWKWDFFLMISIHCKLRYLNFHAKNMHFKGVKNTYLLSFADDRLRLQFFNVKGSFSRVKFHSRNSS